MDDTLEFLSSAFILSMMKNFWWS